MLKLSISNIARSVENDEQVYALMKKYGFQQLETAPTKIFLERPIYVELKTLSEKEDYDRFISNEMCEVDDLAILEKKMSYIRGVFT